ncbi:hypothetical protein DFH27DRAFT_609660 [Peziza echinospora]|nr:hypothetical protein DFH27DRAFT_609660 [Peziza echinospora]
MAQEVSAEVIERSGDNYTSSLHIYTVHHQKTSNAYFAIKKMSNKESEPQVGSTEWEHRYTMRHLEERLAEQTRQQEARELEQRQEQEAREARDQAAVQLEQRLAEEAREARQLALLHGLMERAREMADAERARLEAANSRP